MFYMTMEDFEKKCTSNNPSSTRDHLINLIICYIVIVAVFLKRLYELHWNCFNLNRLIFVSS